MDVAGVSMPPLISGGRDATRDGSLRDAMRAVRAELVIAVALLVLVAVSALVVTNQVAAASPAVDCWVAHFSEELDQAEDCEAALAIYWNVQHSAVDTVVLLAVFVPFAVGLLLGTPLTVRLDGQAASGTDRRRLITLILVMLTVVVVGLGLVAWLVEAMWSMAAPWSEAGVGRVPTLDHLAIAPLSFVARGVLAFGVGLLTGALLRRAIPAYALASVVLFVIVSVGAQGLHAAVAEQVAVWRQECTPSDAGAGCEDPPYVYHVAVAFRDTDGTVLTYDEAHAAMLERCPTCGEQSDWIYRTMVVLHRVAPVESFGAFEAGEALAWSAIGGLCIVLTFPVLAWHRRRDASPHHLGTATTSMSG
jgi:hypothetical protein